VSFFDDDAVPEAPAARPRKRGSRARTRIQRLVVLAVILFAVIFGLAYWLRSCQHNRAVSSYRTYLTSVQSALNDASGVTKDIQALINDPTKFSRKQLVAKLDALQAGQQEIVTRVAGVKPPSSLDEENRVFIQGMRARLEGIKLLRQGILAILDVKSAPPSAAKLASYSGFFTGPDVYYNLFFYNPAREVLHAKGITGVTIPLVDPVQNAGLLDVSKLKAVIQRMQRSAKLTGIHGVALVGVMVKPQNVKLVPNREVSAQASPQLVFSVTVENQGTVTETNVPVSITLVPPGTATKQKLSAAIATIAAGQKQTIEIPGSNIPPAAIGRTTIVKVFAGPVPEEHVLSNNVAEYRMLLQLK